MMRPRLGLAMTLCVFALLHSRTAAAQLVAGGKSLTVTTTNAVATFNGADLVGLANSLTNESYLKKPSDGAFVVVDAMTGTGQALQLSNWSVGVESGTGLPLATITAHDSARTFTMTVKVDPASQEIVLRTSAGVTSGGVRGASWSIAGMDLGAGRWVVPVSSGAVFDAAHPGTNADIHYGTSWQAQMAVYEAALGSLLLYSTDNQFLFKSLRQSSRGDSTLDVAVYTEAAAPWPSATTVPQCEWRLKAFAGDWRAAATPFRDWMLANRPPVSNAAHPWVSNIRNVVAVSGLDSTVLAPLAATLSPSQTLLYMVNWRQSDYDVNYPDYTPAANAAPFIVQAHALGFKVMLHTDIIGVAAYNADYASVQQYQTRTPDTLELMGWNWDQPSTPERYGIIDVASSAFRALWIQRVGAAVTALNPDALHLDFSASYNDGNGPIEGRTFPQGEDLFNQQIVAAFPNLALGSELVYDFTYRYQSFAQAGFWFSAGGHPISNFLFSPQVQFYGHLSTPVVTDFSFKSVLLQDMERGIFPLWWVNSTSDLDGSNPNIARFTRMAQSWQHNAFQPAWTEDWAGAVVRYQGQAGATAAFTDTGQLATLATPQSQLLQIAHDANQVTSASYIDSWAAFDSSSLFGLDPAVNYFLDPAPRPDVTHATSLPAGIRLGAGTVVTPSFAHIELTPPPSFDFFNLSQARVGVSYQNADYPLGYGAAVQPQTNIVGGESRPGIFIHPPWQGQIGGETFVEYSVSVPASAALQFSVGINDGATCTDGVTFRVTAAGTELWHQNYGLGAWHDAVLSLAAYAGTTIPLRLISNPGPGANPTCDWSAWSRIALVAPTPSINVPLALASASTFSAIDGASYIATSSSTGTVQGAAVPGGFTVFTQPGQGVGSGTNLATRPFDVRHWDKDGSTMQPGSVFSAGTVQSETSGGVTKNPAIWAHPPNISRTVLLWTLHLPATPLALGWSAGLIDGANSDDGVDFSVLINGAPYWTLTTGAHGDNHWTAGQLNLSRWAGQTIVVELVTDSRSNFSFDWAAWADLVMSPSGVTCSYSVPASASIGAIGGSFTASVTAATTCPWLATSNAAWITVTSGSGSGNGSATYAVAPNAGDKRTGTLTIGGQTLTITQDPSPTPNGDSAGMTLDRNSLVFAAVNNGAAFTAVTGAQTVRMTQSGPGTVAWTARSSAPWLVVSPTSGSGTASLTISMQFAPGLTPTQTGTITMTLTGAGNPVGPITVTLKSIADGTSQPPFGSFDTPADGTTGLAGSVPVTGWTLDDVGVNRVTICRSAITEETLSPDARCNNLPQAYIGDAVFIDGARPDVQSAFPTAPMSTRAGWGYLMLTNFLPDATHVGTLGNGTFTLYAYAFDADGHTAPLGTKTITCDNASSLNPFGAIDTPAQGEVISGSYTSFGWVLSPGAATADGADGGTVQAFVDGTLIGTPGGWTARSDLTSLFPVAQYSGVGKSLAVIGINSTSFGNGLHTYSWNVTDTAGRSGGIGSRFIGISNGSLTLDPSETHASNVIPATNVIDFPRAAALRIGSSTASLLAEVNRAPSDEATVEGRRSFDLDRPLQAYPSENGRVDVQAEELDRVELHLSASSGNHYSGYLRTAAGLMPLPIGAHLDALTGEFTWMPGVGFYGVYGFVFVRWNNGAAAARQDVQITLNAKGSNRVGPQTIIDVPGAGRGVFRAGDPFFLGGWAADLDAAADTGVAAVHVWAYPLDADGNRQDPQFLGAAIHGGARPDVAAVYGDRFLTSGYGMIVPGLAPGTYDIAVFGLSTVVGHFTSATVVRVVVR